MKKKLTIIISTFLFSSAISNCLAQSESLYQDSIEGLWRANWQSEYWYEAFPNEDAGSGKRCDIHSTYIYIEGDSLWTLDYPCRRISKEVLSPTDYELQDSLRLKYDRLDFIKVSFDSSAIENLKKNKINSQCYLGAWSLIRMEFDERDGSSATIVYPFDISDSLIITNKMVNEEVLDMFIEGRKRTFSIELEKLNFDGNRLLLKPIGDWSENENRMWYSSSPNPLSKKELDELKHQEKDTSVELYLLYERH